MPRPIRWVTISFTGWLFILILAGCTTEKPETLPSWTLSPKTTSQPNAMTARFISVRAVDENVVWASGELGTFARTTDGGATWQVGTVPNADTLQFRDVHPVDAQTAYLLSIGPGASSRIYKTTDAGASWTLQHTNDLAQGFFDCMDFWDADHGILFSDSVADTLVLLVTRDGGSHWERIPPEQLPPANPDEGSFAASGTCLVTQGDSTAWVGTGASTAARVLKTTNRGRTWTVAETPVVHGTSSSGLATLTFRDALHGTAMGGELTQPDQFQDNVAVTADGGQTWTLAGRPSFPGPVYGSDFVPNAPTPTLVAVGPGGISFSTDEGMHWTALDTLTHWGVDMIGPGTGWAVGPEGRITRISLFEQQTAKTP